MITTSPEVTEAKQTYRRVAIIAAIGILIAILIVSYIFVFYLSTFICGLCL